MKAFTVAEYAQAKGMYRQLALLRVQDMLSKGLIRPSETIKTVRGKVVSTYEFLDGSEIDVLPAKPVLQFTVDPRFFSDPFNRTNWRTA